jgi:hypothetical protein
MCSSQYDTIRDWMYRAYCCCAATRYWPSSYRGILGALAPIPIYRAEPALGICVQLGTTLSALKPWMDTCKRNIDMQHNMCPLTLSNTHAPGSAKIVLTYLPLLCSTSISQFLKAWGSGLQRHTRSQCEAQNHEANHGLAHTCSTRV